MRSLAIILEVRYDGYVLDEEVVVFQGEKYRTIIENSSKQGPEVDLRRPMKGLINKIFLRFPSYVIKG